MTLGTFTLGTDARPAALRMVLGRDTVTVRRIESPTSP